MLRRPPHCSGGGRCPAPAAVARLGHSGGSSTVVCSSGRLQSTAAAAGGVDSRGHHSNTSSSRNSNPPRRGGSSSGSGGSAAMDIAKRALDALQSNRLLAQLSGADQQRHHGDDGDAMLRELASVRGGHGTQRNGTGNGQSAGSSAAGWRRGTTNNTAGAQQYTNSGGGHGRRGGGSSSSSSSSAATLTGLSLEELEEQLMRQGRRNIRDPSLIVAVADEMVRRPLVPFLALQHAQLLGDADADAAGSSSSSSSVLSSSPSALSSSPSSHALNPFRYAIVTPSSAVGAAIRASRFQQALLRYQRNVSHYTPSKHILSYGRLVRDTVDMAYAVGEYDRCVELYLQRAGDGLGPYIQSTTAVVDAAFLLPTPQQALEALRQLSVVLLDRLALCPADGLTELCVYRCFWRACVLWRDARLEAAPSLNIVRAGRRKLRTEAEREIDKLKAELEHDTSLRAEQRDVLRQILAASPDGSTLEWLKASSTSTEDWPQEVRQAVGLLASAEETAKHIYYGALSSPLILGAVDPRAAASFEAYWAASTSSGSSSAAQAGASSAGGVLSSVFKSSKPSSSSSPAASSSMEAALLAAEVAYSGSNGDIEWREHQLVPRGGMAQLVEDHFKSYRPYFDNTQRGHNDGTAASSSSAAPPPPEPFSAPLEIPRDTCFPTLWRTSVGAVLYNDATDDGCAAYEAVVFDRLLKRRRTEDILKAAVPSRQGASSSSSLSADGQGGGGGDADEATAMMMGMLAGSSSGRGNNSLGMGAGEVDEYTAASSSGAARNTHTASSPSFSSLQQQQQQQSDRQLLLQTSAMVQRMMQSCVADYNVAQCLAVFNWYWACCSRGVGTVGGPPLAASEGAVLLGGGGGGGGASLSTVTPPLPSPPPATMKRTVEGVILFTLLQSLVDMKAYQEVVTYWGYLTAAMRAEEEDSAAAAANADDGSIGYAIGSNNNKVIARPLLHKASVIAIVARCAGELKLPTLTVELVQLLLDTNDAPSPYEVFICLTACARSQSPHFPRMLQVIIDNKVATVSEEEQRYLTLQYYASTPALTLDVGHLRNRNSGGGDDGTSPSSGGAADSASSSPSSPSSPEPLALIRSVAADLQVLLDERYTRPLRQHRLQQQSSSGSRGGGAARAGGGGSSGSSSYAASSAAQKGGRLGGGYASASSNSGRGGAPLSKGTDSAEPSNDGSEAEASQQQQSMLKRAYLDYPTPSGLQVSAAEGALTQRVLSALLSLCAQPSYSHLLLAMFDVVDKVGSNSASMTSIYNGSGGGSSASSSQSAAVMLKWLEHIVLYANAHRYQMSRQERSFIYEQVVKYGLHDRSKWTIARYMASGVRRGTARSYPFLRKGYAQLGLRYVDAPPPPPPPAAAAVHSSNALGMGSDSVASPSSAPHHHHHLHHHASTTLSSGKSLLPKQSSLWGSLGAHLSMGGGGAAAAEGAPPHASGLDSSPSAAPASSSGAIPIAIAAVAEHQAQMPMIDGSRRVTVIGGPLSDSFRAQLTMFMQDYTAGVGVGVGPSSTASAAATATVGIATSHFAAKTQSYPSSSLHQMSSGNRSTASANSNTSSSSSSSVDIVSTSEWAANARRSAVDSGLTFMEGRLAVLSVPKLSVPFNTAADGADGDYADGCGGGIVLLARSATHQPSPVEADYARIDLPMSLPLHLQEAKRLLLAADGGDGTAGATSGSRKADRTYIFKPDYYYTAGATQTLNEWVNCYYDPHSHSHSIDHDADGGGEQRLLGGAIHHRSVGGGDACVLLPWKGRRGKRGSVGQTVPDTAVLWSAYASVKEALERELQADAAIGVGHAQNHGDGGRAADDCDDQGTAGEAEAVGGVRADGEDLATPTEEHAAYRGGAFVTSFETLDEPFAMGLSYADDDCNDDNEEANNADGMPSGGSDDTFGQQLAAESGGGSTDGNDCQSHHQHPLLPHLNQRMRYLLSVPSSRPPRIGDAGAVGGGGSTVMMAPLLATRQQLTVDEMLLKAIEASD